MKGTNELVDKYAQFTAGLVECGMLESLWPSHCTKSEEWHMAVWVITKDVIGDGEDDGTAGPQGADDATIEKLKKGDGFPFRMFDDDGELYYEGYCALEDFAPLDDFGMPNAGCTEIKYRNEKGWSTL